MSTRSPGLSVRGWWNLGRVAVLSGGLLASCTLSQSLDSLQDGQCPDGQKACSESCVPLNDPATGCASDQCTACNSSNGTAVCRPDGSCGIGACNDGYGDCDDNAATGCESDLNTDSQNCRSCGRVCSVSKARTACVDGQCSLIGCDPGWADCNKSYGDGCEAEIAKDTDNCGQCGNACAPGRACEGGVCLETVAVFSSASSRHSCATLNSKVTLCWGDNSTGQLGINQACSSPPCAVTTASQVPNLPDIQEVATGDGHTCAVNLAGVVFCWGANTRGQLGLDESGEPRLTPRSVAGVQNVKSVAAGANHTCALGKDGSVWCWGEGSKGQTGVANAPTNVESPSKVMLGAEPLSGATRIAAGGDTTCAIVSPGTIYCWGDNRAGQLGNGGASADTCKPGTEKACAYAPTAVPGIDDAVGVSVGLSHMCYARTDGSVWCAGAGTNGELGDGLSLDSPTPVRADFADGVTGLSDPRAGGGHACVVQPSNATLWCWGSNDKGRLFAEPGTTPNRTEPTLIGSAANVSRVSPGRNFTCILSAGSVSCVGDNSYGQLGLSGNPDNFAHPSPTKVQGLP